MTTFGAVVNGTFGSLVPRSPLRFFPAYLEPIESHWASGDRPCFIAQDRIFASRSGTLGVATPRRTTIDSRIAGRANDTHDWRCTKCQGRSPYPVGIPDSRSS